MRLRCKTVVLEYVYMDTNLTLPKKAALDVLRKKYYLRLILLHGSHVGTLVHPESDIDIAVLRDQKKPAFRYGDLVSDLIESFDSDRIDLVDLTHADPLLLFAATNNCQLLSGTEDDLNALQLLAFHRYNDYCEYLKAERNFIRKKLQNYVTA